jgi:hypothetical protein
VKEHRQHKGEMKMKESTIIQGFQELHKAYVDVASRSEGLSYQTTLNSFRWVALMRILEEKKICTTQEINTMSQKILDEQAAQNKAVEEAAAQAANATSTGITTPEAPKADIITPTTLVAPDGTPAEIKNESVVKS